jgi:tetratricopeptide (TPR) repeat protein
VTAGSGGKRQLLAAAGVLCLFVVLGLQLAFVANANSITWDEDDHIYAGYMSLKKGDFGINPEHPPMVKMVAALPILNMPLKLPVIHDDRFFKTDAFLGGKDFIFQNDANTIVYRTRMAASIFTFLLVVFVYTATREIFGKGAAFIALALLVFDPNLIAHGAVVTTDVGVSCFMFATVYAFYRYVKAPSTPRLLLVGLAAGLGLAAKHTGILIFPMLALLAICELLRRGKHNEESFGKHAGRLAASLIVVGVIAVAVLWSFYGFRYNARPDGLKLTPSMQEFASQVSRRHEAKMLSLMAKYKVLPESYLYGLADVRGMGDFYQSYVLGKVYPHGVWFYFPIAFVVKSTLTFLILLLLAIVAIATRKLTCWREILFLTVPPAFHFLVAVNSTMNIGVRHILPVYAFLTVLLAGAAWKLIEKDRRWAYAVVFLLAFQAVSSARTYPAYLAYANELWGGPSNTYKYLTDSNVDWAQQLKSTKQYLDERGIKDCWFVYFAEGVVETSYYGIPCKPLPTMDSLWVDQKIAPPPSIDGTVLISAGDLSGFEFGAGPQLNPYEQFKSIKPTAVIDYGVFVYDGHFEIPIAASIGHAQKAWDLLGAKQPEQALIEAQTAAELAPDTVRANTVLGDALSALNRREEAQAAYAKALKLAKTVEPEFQKGAIPDLEKKVAALSNGAPSGE